MRVDIDHMCHAEDPRKAVTALLEKRKPNGKER
jgi:hypothetical protein